MKYLPLTKEDKIQAGDLYGSEKASFADSYLGLPGDYGAVWYRPIPEDNWISFKDRKPTKEDASTEGWDCGHLHVRRHRVNANNRRGKHWKRKGINPTKGW